MPRRWRLRSKRSQAARQSPEFARATASPRGLFTLHVARRGRKGRHFVICRIGDAQGSEVIEVLRLLHDAMDLPRHMPPINERE